MFLKSKSFGNEIFALFIDTFLDGKCGISNKYKEKMAVTKSGSTLTIASGCVCIRGRFIEEDTSTSITAETDNAYCKLVIEIDLSKENTDSQFVQADYKILKGVDSYPYLTQTDIVANNNGVYQFELAQFRTTTAGIVDFVDKRTYLDFKSLYSSMETEYREVLQELQEELSSAKDLSIYALKDDCIKKANIKTLTINNSDGKKLPGKIDYLGGMHPQNSFLISSQHSYDTVQWYDYKQCDISFLADGMHINCAEGIENLRLAFYVIDIDGVG